MDPLGDVAEGEVAESAERAARDEGRDDERDKRARRGERGADDGVPPAIDRVSERAEYDGSQSSPRHEDVEARMSSGLLTLSL